MHGEIFGTDNGKPCPSCGCRIWTFYNGEAEDSLYAVATCVGCKRADAWDHTAPCTTVAEFKGEHAVKGDRFKFKVNALVRVRDAIPGQPVVVVADRHPTHGYRVTRNGRDVGYWYAESMLVAAQ